jgi:hypothetical protein
MNIESKLETGDVKKFDLQDMVGSSTKPGIINDSTRSALEITKEKLDYLWKIRFHPFFSAGTGQNESFHGYLYFGKGTKASQMTLETLVENVEIRAYLWNLR